MRRLLHGLLCLFMCLSTRPASLQAQGLDSAVNALLVVGDTLWIGQGSTLLLVRLQVGAARIEKQYDLQAGTIRSIAARDAYLIILTDDRLLSLAEGGQVLDQQKGGGQQALIVPMSDGRHQIWISALEAGLRVYTLELNGALRLLRSLPTAGMATALAWDGSTVWAALGNAGAARYGLDSEAALAQIATPVALLASSDGLLFTADGPTLTIYDIASQAATVVVLPAPVLALAPRSGQLYVGLSGTPDTLVLVENGQISGQFAYNGAAGETLAIWNDDLFVGSVAGGLLRLTTSRGQLGLVEAWPVVHAVAPCLPTDPTPANLSNVQDPELILSWESACAASHELWVNGVLLATISASTDVATPNASTQSFAATPASARYEYTFTAQTELVQWQVVAIDGNGNRTEGAHWRFSAILAGWVATARQLPDQTLIYSPPIVLPNPESPSGLLFSLCGIAGLGMALIVGAALLLGGAGQRKR
jgi:hypothetical protein